MDKLKPCPFCGSKDIEFRNDSNLDAHGHDSCEMIVACKDCGSESPSISVMPAKKLASILWNMRA